MLEGAGADGDFAQSYLKTHDAGTGPFTITDFDLGTKYMLTASTATGAPKPDVKTININIIPDISTQRLKLESRRAEHDHPRPVDRRHRVASKATRASRCSASRRFFKTLVMVNPNKGVFKDQALRTALRRPSTRRRSPTEVYGDNGTVSTQIYPAGELPDGHGHGRHADARPVEAGRGGAGPFRQERRPRPTRPTTPATSRLAELVQTELQAAGLDATARGIPIAQVFDLPNHPDRRPTSCSRR